MPAVPAETVLYRAGGITVTTGHIIDQQWGRLPIDHVLSVKPGQGFLPGTVVVDVFDLVRHSRRFKFRGADNAKRFIGALQRAKGSIQVEQDSSGWFIIWG